MSIVAHTKSGRDSIRLTIPKREQICLNRSKSTFLRHMIVYGAVYDVDYAYLREFNYLLGKIGGNLNQIAKRINETRSIYQTDMDAVKAEMDRLWKVQIAMLKKQPVLEQ